MRMALETVTHRTFLPILPSFPIPTSRSSVPSPEPRARPRVPFESPQGPFRRSPPHPRVPAPATRDGARGGPSRPGLAARPSQDGGLAARPGDTAWGGGRDRSLGRRARTGAGSVPPLPHVRRARMP